MTNVQVMVMTTSDWFDAGFWLSVGACAGVMFAVAVGSAVKWAIDRVWPKGGR